MKLLIVTAVAAEQEAVLHGLDARSGHGVAVVGVGPAAAAAGTARALALAEAGGTWYDGVVNAGIAGAFEGRAAIGDTLVSTDSVCADLGVRTADGFKPIDALGFGTATVACATGITQHVTGTRGRLLTLSTVTGTAADATALATHHPTALGEAMEGFGAASAAAAVDLDFAEIRTVSNFVGERDTGSWDFDAAFAALSRAMEELR